MTISPLPPSAPGRIECEIELTGAHPHFKGHFDGFPVLPGVSQVDLVLHLLEKALGRPVALLAVQKTKFTALMRPGTHFRAAIDFAAGQARWAFQDEGTVYSRGSLVYA